MPNISPCPSIVSFRGRCKDPVEASRDWFTIIIPFVVGCLAYQAFLTQSEQAPTVQAEQATQTIDSAIAARLPATRQQALAARF